MSYHIKSYTFKGNAEEAFNLLLSLSPYEIWEGTTGRGPGQVYFLELDIIKKMQIPVAFKVVELDKAKKTFSFSYLKQNKSQGIQRITFEQDCTNFKINHETHYKSDSKFRDKHRVYWNDIWESFEKRL